jgi:hypothetical protein
MFIWVLERVDWLERHLVQQISCCQSFLPFLQGQVQQMQLDHLREEDLLLPRPPGWQWHRDSTALRGCAVCLCLAGAV